MASGFTAVSSAHTTGISQATFVVDESRQVHATLVFAAPELTVPEVDRARFVLDGVGVSADGAACAGTFDGSRTVEMDGVELDATFACAKDAHDVEVVLYFLNELAPGHRSAASIAFGSRSTQKLLTGEKRLVALALDDAKPVLSKSKTTALVVVTTVWLALLIGVLVWRLRRAPRQKRLKNQGSRA